jgi:uncharacterized protein
MRTSVPKLDETEHETLSQKIQAITRAVRPEKIICFGLRKTVSHSWSCFIDHEPSAFIECDLLIITKDGDALRYQEVLETLDEYNEPRFRFSAIVHGIYSVNNSLQDGNRFFAGIHFTGIRLFLTMKKSC